MYTRSQQSNHTTCICLVSDNSTLAYDLYKRVRVLCWIMTSPENLQKKAIHIKNTWAKRCNIALFVSDNLDTEFPTINITVKPGREYLTVKTMAAFHYIYQHYRDQADWFMKADDDTYVIVENLRYLLSAHNPEDPVYFGHHFRSSNNEEYTSGGAGYVLSREALRRLGNRKSGDCYDNVRAEDIAIGLCMKTLGVDLRDSRDSMNRSRFHCFPPHSHIINDYPDWYFTHDVYGGKHVSS